MYSFVFEHIETFENQIDFNSGRFLWVWNADKIPPHIGISVNGLYYSLKVKGKDENLPVASILEVITNKSIPSVAIGIELNPSKSISTCFEGYKKAQSGKSSCLSPIVDYFGMTKVNYLFELLNHLEASGKLGSTYGFNLCEDYKGIAVYGREEIENRLKILEDVKRGTHIS